MTHEPFPGAPGTCLVACLCAAWCRSCEEYRATFETLANENQASARFVWVDIEDDEETLGPVEIVAFPTLLIAVEDRVVFFGAVSPKAQPVRQLLRRARHGELGGHLEAGLPDLLARIRRLP